MTNVETSTEWRIVLSPLAATVESSSRVINNLQPIFVCTRKSAHLNACPGTWSSCKGRVTAEHCHTRAELGATQRYHVFSARCAVSGTSRMCMMIQNALPDMAAHQVALMGCSIDQNPLNQIVTILIPRNCVVLASLLQNSIDFSLTVNQRHTRPVCTTSANTCQVAIQKLRPPNFQTLLYNFRSKLIHAVIRTPKEYVFDCTVLVARSAMLTNVLNTPISKLTMGKEVDIGQDLFDSRAL
jgi:hypothetical protein